MESFDVSRADEIEMWTSTLNFRVHFPIGRIDGLPIGGQLIVPAFNETGMLAVGMALEQAIDPTAEALS